MQLRPLPLLLLCVGLFAASGATCPRRFQPYPTQQARALPQSPTLEQIIQVVNENSAKIHSISAQQASITVPGAPSLRASLAAEQSRRFRLKAGTMLTGDEVDIGSNDELFWIWVKRNQPPSMYVCRHDQFARSAAKAIMPVQPEWLLEALGMTRFDPALRHSGPVPVQGGRLEVRTVIPGAQGDLTRITIVDEARGWVLEQHLYDAQGQRLATAKTDRHRLDASGAVVPQRVEIQWPPAQITMKIDMPNVQVNALNAQATGLWTRPEIAGYPIVDLADPNLQFGPPAKSAAVQPPASNAPPPTYAPQPVYAQQPAYAQQPLPAVQQPQQAARPAYQSYQPYQGNQPQPALGPYASRPER